MKAGLTGNLSLGCPPQLVRASREATSLVPGQLGAGPLMLIQDGLDPHPHRPTPNPQHSPTGPRGWKCGARHWLLLAPVGAFWEGCSALSVYLELTFSLLSQWLT